MGIGPGGSDYIPARALQVIKTADVIVGYKRYIELLPQELTSGKEVISTGMKGEIKRCQMAIEAALQDRKTCIVSSGDPGIYAMAGLVFELIKEMKVQDILEVEVVPGLPAFVAAAALLGAPLMHDFAVISLSDLLTPWQVIEKRLQAALQADFVLVLYNPKSRKRDWQLDVALQMVRKYRGDQAVVGVVRNATRDGQEVWATRAAEIDTSKIDMLTILIVGNSTTYLMNSRMVTPRGYLEKYRP